MGFMTWEIWNELTPMHTNHFLKIINDNEFHWFPRVFFTFIIIAKQQPPHTPKGGSRRGRNETRIKCLGWVVFILWMKNCNFLQIFKNFIAAQATVFQLRWNFANLIFFPIGNYHGGQHRKNSKSGFLWPPNKHN